MIALSEIVGSVLLSYFTIDRIGDREHFLPKFDPQKFQIFQERYTNLGEIICIS